MKNLSIVFILMLFTVSAWAQMISETYTLGDIPTTYNTSPTTATLADSPGILTVTIPVGATLESVDVEYDMTAHNGAWMSEQRSYMRCTSPGGTAEPQIYSGSGLGGTFNYERLGLDIADNVTTNEIVFELHAFRTWGADPPTGTNYNYVNNNTWTVTVHYLLAGAPGVPTNPIPEHNASGVDHGTGISWTNGVDTDNVEVFFGTDNPPTVSVYDGVAVESLTNAQIGGPLDELTTYYWRVVASNVDHTTQGPVWNFTTGWLDAYQIGFGTINNTGTTYPAPYGNWYWGSRQQKLIPAAELHASGMAAPGFIESLAFDVVGVEGTQLNDFTIKIRTTDATTLTAFITDDLNTVWGPTHYTEVEGWNNHVFTTPFFWDGVSNLLIETSFGNTSYTNNAIFNQTATPGYVSTITYRADSTYDYNNPSIDISSEQRVNMVFSFDMVDAGTLDGHVNDSTTGDPIADAIVEVLDSPYITTTNDLGYFIFTTIQAGTYDVKATKFGYDEHILEDVVVTADTTTTINFTIGMLDNVTVSGQVAGSDAPTVGLEGAEVELTGYDDYSTVTGPNGMFSIPGVFTNQTYDIHITVDGYSPYSGEVVVGETDLDLGVIIVDEIAFPVSNVVAEISDQNNVDVTWNMPGTGVMTEFRYDDGVVDAQLGFQGDNNSVMGAVHRRDAQIHEMSWITTAEGGPHNTVNVFVFGLDAAGMPDRNNILYQSMNVPNVDLQWNVYEFPAPIDAPDGFLIGLSYNGFLGLAVDDGIGAPWEFVPNTQFGIFDYTDLSYDWTDISFWGFEVNYLIRAQGYDYGDITRSGVRVASNRESRSPYSRAGSEIVEISTGSSVPGKIHVGEPVYNSSREQISLHENIDVIRNNRELEGYVVYRFLAQDQDDEDIWTELTTLPTPTDTTYTDTGWSTLDPGIYQYSVKALYTNNVLSPAAFSNVLEHAMSSLVTINLTTNSGDPVTGAQVTLINVDDDPDHVYSMTAPASGILVFPNVWRGTYRIEASLDGFEDYVAHDVEILTDTFNYNIELIELLLPVLELTYEVHDENNVTLNWLHPLTTFGDPWEEGFETGVLPAGWEIMGVNNDTSPTIPGFWTINSHSSADYSPIGQYHAGLWWSYNHQDEWLITDEFTCPPDSDLVYWTVGFRGSTNADHYYVKVSTDSGVSWTVLQDLSAMTGEWNYYDTPMTVPLDAYGGQDIMLAWNAVDGPTNDGLWYIWFVDEISVGEMTFRATDLTRVSKGVAESGRATERALLGYKVMRNDVVLIEDLDEDITTFTDENVPNGTYVYGVIAQYTSGEADAVETEEIIILSADEDVITIPMVTELQGNYPNPFNPDTRINFSLKEDAFVVMEIYNIKGQKVRTLVSEEMEAGYHTVVWNGRNDQNREAGSGVYFYRMKAGEYSSTRKMILMK